MTVWLFLHLLGFTLWLGGGVASMVIGLATKREDRAVLGAIARAQGAVHKAVIGPGALLVTLSGLMLTFRLGATDVSAAHVWLIVMQGAGLLGALIVLFVSVPTAAKLSRLDPVAKAAFFDELRQRQRLVGSVAGVLALLSLVAGVLLRTGT